MYNSLSPLEAVLNLAIDDGVSNRGHRTNIFKKNFYFTGVDTEMHKKYTSMTVIDYSGANKPDTSYKAPTIDVPTTMSGYTDYSKWN